MIEFHDIMPIMTECVQCGYCCSKRPCSYGEWDYKNNKCKELTKYNKCSKYDEITEKEKNSQYPMMGSGCSSSLFNDVRDAKLKKINKL